ncbi:MAG: polyphenol oxidase family protein, partial [Lachnospiraceae bacterium]|nr:polyphenol oxidase family protein [Lachnospiraceae bacterium]
VSQDVAEHFLGEFWEKYHNDKFCRLTTEPAKMSDSLLCRKKKPPQGSDEDGEDIKYQLNLWVANQCVLEKAGILPEHIEVTSLCTCCNSGELFSHRASRGQRGNLGAFLGLV